LNRKATGRRWHALARHALEQLAALHPQLTAAIRRVVVAGDVATVINCWQLRGRGPDGASITMHGSSADVMRRRPDGSWGILIDDPWALPTRARN
jgi:ketosteroid isomerase-like protein